MVSGPAKAVMLLFPVSEMVGDWEGMGLARRLATVVLTAVPVPRASVPAV